MSPSIQLHLFKSTSDDLVRALTDDPNGKALPRTSGPWRYYERSEGLMQHVRAVSDEIEDALNARGYYLIRFPEHADDQKRQTELSVHENPSGAWGPLQAPPAG